MCPICATTPQGPLLIPLPHILPRDPMDHCLASDDSHIWNSGPGPLSQWTSEYLHWKVPLMVKLNVPQTSLYHFPS